MPDLPTPRWAPRAAPDFVHAFLAKLPLGEAWPRRAGSLPHRVASGLMGVVGRWAERVAMLLLTEAFPPTSYLMLPDWERVLGLPEPCIPAAQTLDERRAAVLEKLRRRPGAQSRAYFIGIAERLGYHETGESTYGLERELPAVVGQQLQTTIREFRPFMFGVSRCGDARWRIAPPEMRFVWVVNVPGQRLSWFRFGQSRCGQDPHLRIARAEDLECVLRRYKPAHTRLIFSYQGD
jgi:uncharacterized protein YmfQ (DUF2313 family)